MTESGRTIRRWLPHALLLGMVAASAAWLAAMLAPLLPAMLLGLSLGLVTYPVVFAPVHRRLERWFPRWDERPRRTAAAGASVALLGASLVGAAGALLWGLVGKLSTVVSLVQGMMFGNKAAIDKAINAIAVKAQGLLKLYPDLPLQVDDVRTGLQAVFAKTGVGQEFLRFLAQGSGSFLAQAALMTVLLFYLYAWGPTLVRSAFGLLPLKDTQRTALGDRYRMLALHMGVGLFVRAGAHGFAAGSIAGLIAGFPPVAIGLLAAVLALLPVVGPVVVWLPLATLLWSQNRPVEAVCLAIASATAAFAIDGLIRRWARSHGTDRPWIGILVFLSLVGGVLGFGWRGLLLGPAAVLASCALAGFIPALYGIHHDDEPATPPAT